MAKLSDKDIRDLWAKHYSERVNNPRSKTLCIAICGMVEDRARRIKDSSGKRDNLEQALREMGIPIRQYDQVQSEQSDK